VLYRLVFALFLKRIPAETAHHLGFAALRFAMAIPGVRALVAWACRPRNRPVAALGLSFPGPLGLAAGFDKDARAYDQLGALGFGFVEIGTITAKAQPGNPQPRLFRLPADRALVNRMGFNNGGAVAAAERLARGRKVILGVNIGKSKVTPEEEAIGDYVESARLLAPHADYLVVNVSSPNTPGLRNLQAVDKLRPLLVAVRQACDAVVTGRRVPLLVKIAPDLNEADIDAVADMALELGLDGIIATNTTISREGLASSPAEIEAVGAGGLSGAPLRERSLAVLRRLKARVGDKVVLIAAGGIADAADARARLAAGATLLQGYTAFVYGGPLWARRLQRGLD
jgi:dihydroorotate dehydrogenase